MPDIATHRRQVQHNQQVRDYLQAAGDDQLDWVVTVAFYTALHLVDQALAQLEGLHPRNHRERNRILGRQPSLTSIWRDYAELRTQSERSRYECATFNADEVRDLTTRLERIEQVVSTITA